MERSIRTDRINRVSRRDFIRLAGTVCAASAVGLPALEVHAGPGEDRSNLPVVIIGAGLGGLTAAASLAKHGFPVTVLESHDRPGGYATSFERAAGRFNFEVSLHAATGGVLDRLLYHVGAQGKVEFVRLPELAVLRTEAGDISLPQADPEAFIAALVKAYPNDELGIKGFIGDILDIADEAEKSFDQDSWLSKLVFPFTHSAMWNVRNQTLADMLEPYDISPQCRNTLCSWWGYYGLPPDRLSGFYYAIATGQMIKRGADTVKRRSQDLSWALGEAVEAAGGSCELETRATAITTRDGRVSGVVDSTGRTWPARVVVSNASLPATLGMLPAGAAPAEYTDRAAGLAPSISTFTVWLGLNQDLRGKIEGYEYFLGADRDPEAAYRAALECDPHRSGLGVTLWDNAYPGYSKPGSGTVGLLVLSGYEPWRRFEADYRAGRKENYQREKNRITEILIDRAEKELIPGLRSMIVEKEAATPLTNMRYTGNPEGAIYGLAQGMDNAYMNRIANRTPVPGLYLASAWGNPGGGFVGVMMGGRNCSVDVMRDLGFKVEAAM